MFKEIDSGNTRMVATIAGMEQYSNELIKGKVHENGVQSLDKNFDIAIKKYKNNDKGFNQSI